MFVILGMQLFSGTFGSCSDPTILIKEECVDAPPSQFFGFIGGADDGAQAEQGGGGGEQSLHWTNPAFGSFDDFGAGMRLLYAMSSADSWEQPMTYMMGATAPGVAPGRNDFSPMGNL